MIDFLKANPYVTKEEYLWKWTIPQIKIASFDFTHNEYLEEEDKKMRNIRQIRNARDMMQFLDPRIPVINKKI